MTKHNRPSPKGLRRSLRRKSSSTLARFVPQVERLEDRSLMAVAAFTLVLTDSNGAVLADTARLSVNQNLRVNVNVQDVRADSEFDALIADIRASNPRDTRTANDLKGFAQAFLDLNFNPSFVQSTVTIPEQFTFGNAFLDPDPVNPDNDFVEGTISNALGKINDVGDVAEGFGNTPLQNGNQMLFFTAPFRVSHAPLDGRSDSATVVQGATVDIPVLANDKVEGTVNFTGSAAELSSQNSQVWMILRGGDDPQTNGSAFPLTSASQLSFTNDSLIIGGTKKIKVGSISGLAAGASATIVGDVIRYTAPAGFTGVNTITYQLQNADDLNGPVQSVSVAITVTDVNDPPTFTTSTATTLNINENAGVHTLSFANILAGPGETQNLRFEVSSNNQALISNNSFVRSTLVAQLAAQTGNITFQTVPNASGTATVSVQVRDAGFDGTFGNSDDRLSTQINFTVNVSAINDAPVITPLASAATYVENSTPTVVGGGLTLTDADGNSITGAKVSVTTAGGVLPEDVLGFGALPAGISAAVVTNSSVTFVGTATAAAYQSVLQSLTYRNASENPSTAPRTITFEATDNGSPSAKGTATRTVNIVAVNDAPVIAGTVVVTPVSEAGAAVTVAADLTLTDVDSATLASASVQIGSGFQANLDQLTFTPQAGITGNYNAATGLLTFTHSVGSPPASGPSYLTVLKSVRFSTTSVNPGASRNIVFAVNDGSGAANASATFNRNVAIAPANLAPALGQGSATIPKYRENSKTFAVVASRLTLSDADDTTLASAQVRISGNFQPGDELAFTALKLKGITANYNANTGVLTFTNSNPPATLATWQALLRTVKFRASHLNNDPGTSRTIEFVVNDGSAVNATATLLRTVIVVPKNDAPLIVSTSPTASATFTRQGLPVIIDAALTVSDPDNAQLNRATVKITGFKRGQDKLMFASSANITGTFAETSTTLTLTLTGAASVAEYQAALRSVAYVNTSRTPTAGKRTFLFTVFDLPTTLSKDTLTRTLTIPAGAQSSVGLALAVAASGATQWFSFGTGWNGFTGATATITYNAGVPQSADIRVVNTAGQTLGATISLVNNPLVSVTGTQVSGVTLEVLGGSDSINLQPVASLLGEGEFLVSTDTPHSTSAAPTRLSARRTLAPAGPEEDSLAEFDLEARLRDTAETATVSDDDSQPDTATAGETTQSQIIEARRREGEQYAAAVDALLAAWNVA